MRLLALIGPTASGKSDLAFALAAEFGAEILSCDSVTVYRGLDIGSAKPSEQHRRTVTHHLIDVASPDEQFTVARYVALADAVMADAAARQKPVLLVGGSGLYFRSFVWGLSPLPEADPLLREQLAQRSSADLYAQLLAVDPAAAAKIARTDSVRLIRALEVFLRTGRPISAFHAEAPNRPRYDIRTLGLDPPTDLLRQQIRRRVDAMFQAGFVDEVKRLLERYGPLAPALQSLGYANVVAHLMDEQADVDSLKHDIAQATWRYARRQRTWFRREKEPIFWYPCPSFAPPRDEIWGEAERFWKAGI